MQLTCPLYVNTKISMVPGVAANDAKKLLPGSVGQISRRHGAGADDGRDVAARRRRRRQRLGAPNPVRLYRKERTYKL